MKVLKNMALFVCKLGLFIGTVILLLSFSLESFIKIGVTSFVVNNSFTQEELENNKIDADKIMEVFDYNDIQELIDRCITVVFDDNFNIDYNRLGSELYDFVHNNKKEIEFSIGHEIVVKDIDVEFESDEIPKVNDKYKNDEGKVTFKYIFSNEGRVVLLIFSSVCLICVTLLQWSLYKWIKTLGNTLIVCSLFTTIIGALCNIFLESLVDVTGLNITKGLYLSFGVFGLGVILIIIYIVIVKLLYKKRVAEREARISKIKEEKKIIKK